MKNFNFLSNLLQRVSAMSGMRAETINYGGQPTVNRRANMTSVLRHCKASDARGAQEWCESGARVAQEWCECGARVAQEWLQKSSARVAQGLRKSVRFAATILVLLWIGVGNVWGGDIFKETFVSSNGNNASFGSTSGDANGTLTADNTGWDFANGYGANGAARFGTSSKSGNATTPSISVVNGNSYKLAFKAAPWAANSATITVTITGGTISGESSATSSTMTTGQWNDYEYTIVATSTTMTIKFSASQNRFFLDEVVLSTLAPAVKRTVTWMVNGSVYSAGSPTEEVDDGSKVTTLPTAPNPASYCGAKFMGWTTTDIGSTGLDRTSDAAAITALGLFSDAEHAPTVSGGNVTYYAVFADEE